jgi:small-conductance mechanosensitive channel
MTLRDLLAREFLDNQLGDWALAAAVLLGVYVVLVFLRRWAVRRLERTATTTTTMLDDVVLHGLHRTSKAFLFVLALTAASLALEVAPGRRTLIHQGARLVFLLQFAAWGNGAITFWLHRITRTRAETDRGSITTLNVLAILLRIVLWALVFLLTLQSFGVDVTALITGLGIAGVAVALAVQNVLGDLLASLSIALDKPFVIGDAITVDGFQGTVENIGLKSTRLRALSGEQIIMSNAELLKARIRNYQRQTERRVAFTLTFPLETPPEAMARVPVIVRELLAAEDRVRIDRSHFHAITDQVLAVETVYFVLSADYTLYMDIQQRVNLGLLERLAAEGIRLAVPTRSVVVLREGAARADGAPAALDAARAAGA